MGGGVLQHRAASQAGDAHFILALLYFGHGRR